MKSAKEEVEALSHKSVKKQTIKLLSSLAVLFTFGVSPAAAAHGNLGCDPPESLMPLFELMHTLTELAFLAGVAVGTIGFMTAGIMYMIPGREKAEQGKNVAKHVFIGVLILLSANMIVSFLVNELGGVICG